MDYKKLFKAMLPYIIYIGLFILSLFVLRFGYFVAVALMYLLIGIVLLPAWVIFYFISIFFIWMLVFKNTENKYIKIPLLIVSYIIIVYVLVELDSVSWSSEGNLSFYKKIFLRD